MIRRLILILLFGGMLLLPLGAWARSGPAHRVSALPAPHISVTTALSIARRDVSQHGSLVGSGYISSVEYGNFQKLSSGARMPGIKASRHVWAITYTDTSGAAARARQVIDATTGKVLTRVYYSK